MPHGIPYSNAASGEVRITIDAGKLPPDGTYRPEFGCTSNGDFSAHCFGSREHYARTIGDGELCLIPAVSVDARWHGVPHGPDGRPLPRDYFVFASFPSGTAPRELPRFTSGQHLPRPDLRLYWSTLGAAERERFDSDAQTMVEGSRTSAPLAFERILGLRLHACDQAEIFGWVAKCGTPRLQTMLAEFMVEAAEGKQSFIGARRSNLNNTLTHSLLYDLLGTSTESVRVAALTAARLFGSDFFSDGLKLNLAQIGQQDRSAAVRAEATALAGSLSLDLARASLEIWRSIATVWSGAPA